MVRFAFVLVLSFPLAGCGAIALPALGAAAMSGGAGGLARAGVEITFAGGAVRTFAAPLDEVHDVALATLARLGVKVDEEERTATGVAILRGQAYGRAVTLTLEPVTPLMTRVRTDVRAGLSRDRATATEILVQTERALEQWPSASAGRR